jgi:hypothetical protein
MISYIERLIGKFVTDTKMGTSTTYPIGENSDDLDFKNIEIELVIFFEDYYLNIYNPITIIPSEKELLDFIGLKVIAISETKKEMELVFDNGYKILIDLRNEVYNGPEAMCLSGPNNFCVVWDGNE